MNDTDFLELILSLKSANEAVREAQSVDDNDAASQAARKALAFAVRLRAEATDRGQEDLFREEIDFAYQAGVIARERPLVLHVMLDSEVQRLPMTLRHLRATTGDTQEQLASKLGVTRGAVNHIESGRNTPPLARLTEWAEACGWRAALVFSHMSPAAPPGFEALLYLVADLAEADDSLIEMVYDIVLDEDLAKRLLDAYPKYRRGFEPMDWVVADRS